MRLFSILFLTFLLATSFDCQGPKYPVLWTKYTIDSHFNDTLTFTKNWDYPWYMILLPDGRFEKTLGNEPILSEDTIKLYHTANCITNHQGLHNINNCVSLINNDSITLTFESQLPAYASQLTVKITNDIFRSSFWAVYPYIEVGQELTWQTTKQKLILDQDKYKLGDIIKGYIEIEFSEISNMTLPQNKSNISNYFFRGFFKTQLTDK
jgi:hypothetical protein